MSLATTILGLSLLVILHELGHYLMAKACGMRVLRFSVGFGPALIKRPWGETEFQIAAVPLGGYVLIDGMGPTEDNDPPPDGRAFRSKPVWQRIAVIFAGPLMNWVLAALFVAGLAATIGFHEYDPTSTRVGSVMPDSPASRGGLQYGDQILTIDGAATSNWRHAVETIQQHPEALLSFHIKRGEEELTLAIAPERVGEIGRLGVEPYPKTVKLGLIPAIGAGFSKTWAMTGLQLGQFWSLIVGEAQGSLQGPPGIIKMVMAQARRGARKLIETLAWLSVTLFILNLAPIPALDGGRLVFLALETIRGRPVDHRLEGIIHGVGFLLLMGLVVLVSVRDLITN